MSAAVFVAEARKLRGARWRHRGRKPWAVDCVGLLALAGARAGLIAEDEAGYGREPWDDRLRAGCRARFGEPVPLERMEIGDIVLIRWAAGEPSHMGIVGDHPDGGFTLIHAHNINGVVECRLSERYLKGVVEVFRPRFA